MLAKIISVETEKINKGKTGYYQAEVLYENEKGEKKSWKLISFANPAVYKTISEAKQGDVFDITLTKNDKDYTQWSAAVPATASESSGKVSGTTGTKVSGTSTYGRDFESKEERQLRQRLIVRQSSLAQAVEYTKLVQSVSGEPGLTHIESILAVASQFNAWVWEAPDLFDQPNDNFEDIPL